MPLIYILASTIIVSLISFAGILSISLRQELLKKFIWVLVALSSGAMLGAAFFNLIPEAVASSEDAFIYILGGILLFYIIETLLHWHHCHTDDCTTETTLHTKPYAYMNLLGDGLHNFTDGIIIAAAYVTDINLGIAATVAIILHEIPQEISDFGVLISAGFSRKKALLANFITALTAIIGATLTFFLASVIEVVPILIAMGGGGFLYISLSDLIPELHRERNPKKLLLQIAVLLIGLVLIYLITTGIPEVAI